MFMRGFLDCSGLPAGQDSLPPVGRVWAGRLMAVNRRSALRACMGRPQGLGDLPSMPYLCNTGSAGRHRVSPRVRKAAGRHIARRPDRVKRNLAVGVLMLTDRYGLALSTASAAARDA